MLETVLMLYRSKIVATRVLVEVYFFVSCDHEIEENDVNSIATDEGNVWPLHYDTEINSSRISCIDIANRRVATENGGIYSFEEAINYFSLLIS
jgi:hypothetical protein